MQDSGIGNGSNTAEVLHWAQGDELVNYRELQHGGNLEMRGSGRIEGTLLQNPSSQEYLTNESS